MNTTSIEASLIVCISDKIANISSTDLSPRAESPFGLTAYNPLSAAAASLGCPAELNIAEFITWCCLCCAVLTTFLAAHT